MGWGTCWSAEEGGKLENKGREDETNACCLYAFMYKYDHATTMRLFGLNLLTAVCRGCQWARPALFLAAEKAAKSHALKADRLHQSHFNEVFRRIRVQYYCMLFLQVHE